MITTRSVDELRQLALDDPARARVEAAGAADAAAADGDDEQLAEAACVVLHACLRLGDIEAADDAAGAALAAAERAGAVATGREVRRLRVGVLSELGRAEEALDELSALLADAGRDELGPLSLARATVLLVAGRMSEAQRAFDETIPELERLGDNLRVATALANRANTFRTLGDLDRAEDDLRRAGDVFARADSPFSERTARVHLAALLAGRGRVSAALAELEKARTDDPAFALDEGHVLLDAHLLDEAAEVFGRAASGFAAQAQRNYEAASLVEVARVALLRDDGAAAAASAQRALDLVESSSGHAAEALALLALADADDAGHVDLDALESVGRTEAADAIRVRTALLAERRGDRELVVTSVAPVLQRRGTGLRHRLRRHLAVALVAAADDDVAAARRAVASGLSLLARHQAALGAVDLRAEARGHGEALASLGLRLAAGRGAIDLLLTSERSRAGTSRLPRPPVADDPELGSLLARLRSAQRRLDELDPLDDDRAPVAREVGSLERAVATRRRMRPGAGGRPTTVDERRLREASHEAVLVSFVEVDGDLVRLDLVDGRCRRRDLGSLDELAVPVDGLLRAVTRLADRRVRPAMAAALRRSVDHDAEALTARLLDGVPEGRPLVVVPTGRLHGVPWAALGPLRDRPFVLAASLTGWLDAEERTAARSSSGACAVAGPDLIDAEAEVAAVARLAGDCVALTGERASGTQVAAAM
ncbi:MAG: hypothetical protein AAGF02_12675, partial [Actinomycetota bacterium]